MKRLAFGSLVLGVVAWTIVAATAQPPDREQGPGRVGPPRGGQGGPPAFEPGRVLPPPIREGLNLSDEQNKQLDQLEKEVKERLLKILTDTQKTKLEELRKRRPGGPGGPGGAGGPPRGGPGGGPGGPPPAGPDGPPRPDRDQPPAEAPPVVKADATSSGIAWFATWKSGLAEAQRTGKPIFLVSAAPHCGGVSGIW